MKRSHLLFTLLISLLAFILSSCGFHPRGIGGTAVGNVAEEKFYVEANNFNQFAAKVRTALSRYGAIIVKDPKQAKYIVNVQDVSKTSQLTSVVGGASNNTYNLIYTIKYNIVRPNDKTPVVPDKTLSAQQFWQSNSTIVLAQNNEANRIYNYIEAQLVNNMVNQIGLFLPSNKKSSKKTDTSSIQQS